MDRTEVKKYFNKYSSIENHHFQEFVLKLAVEGLTEGDWVALEKVHGSNFGFVTADGEAIFCAKRSGLLGDEDDFFGSKQVLAEHKDKLKKLFGLVKELYPEMKVLEVFGEIFGGIYKHKDVPAVPGVKHVQKGVYYRPGIGFFGFDIKALPHPGFLPWDQAERLFKECDIFHAETLVKGKLSDLLKFNVETFESTIPGRLNLPLIPKNYAEGIVLKPVVPVYTSKGERAILKKKHSSFAEHSATQIALNAARQEKKRAAGEAVEEPKYSSPVAKLVGLIAGYVTEPRLRGVISKEGIPKAPELGKMMALFSKDVLDDFKKDHGEEFGALEKADQKEVSGAMTKLTTRMIKTNWPQIIAGDF